MWLMRRARATPRGPADVLPARGRPRTWLGAEDSRAPGGHCWAAWASRAGDRRRTRGWGSFRPPQEPASWTTAPPGPKSQGPRLCGPQCWFSLSPFVSACPTGDRPSPSPSLSLFYNCLFCVFTCVLCSYLLSFGLCLLSLMHSLSPGLSRFFFCAPPRSRAFFFPVLAPSSPSSHPAFALSPSPPPNSPNCTCRKREKAQKNSKHKKAKTKTNLACVAKCRVLLVASVCVPVARSLPACPLPSAVCPARLPACPSC